MVLALVLLPALGRALGGEGASGGAGDIALVLLVTLGKVALFLALVLIVGTRAAPWILERVARTGSRELLTLSFLATAHGIYLGSAALLAVPFAFGTFFSSH